MFFLVFNRLDPNWPPDQAPSFMGAPEVLIERLNRGVRKRNARWTFVRDHAFGDALTLRRFRLGNGLTVLTLLDRSAPTVSYHTWFRVGSRHESPGKTGLAHLFEHLMFSETRSHPHGDFDRLMERAGAEANAATWTDWTCYYENAPRDALPLLIELEADRMSNLVLRTPQVASEKEVVANERKLRVEDDIEGKALELLYDSAFRRHPYRRPTIGSMEDIRGFTVRDCKQFYRTHYAPSNATVVIAGDFNEQKALSLVQRHYGGMSAVRNPEPPTPSKEPSQRAERILQLTAPTPTEKLLIGYHAPSFSDPDTPALVIANDVLFGGHSSRLHRVLCLDEEIALSVRGSISPFSRSSTRDFSRCGSFSAKESGKRTRSGCSTGKSTGSNPKAQAPSSSKKPSISSSSPSCTVWRPPAARPNRSGSTRLSPTTAPPCSIASPLTGKSPATT
jgi:zinc protease